MKAMKLLREKKMVIRKRKKSTKTPIYTLNDDYDEIPEIKIKIIPPKKENLVYQLLVYVFKMIRITNYLFKDFKKI